MYNDQIIDACLLGIYTLLIGYVLFMLVWKPFRINVTHLNVSIVLRYQYGLSSYKAVLQRSDAVKAPSILKNFKHFSFVVPMEMSSKDIINWLHGVEISKHYATNGKEALELLRATLLYYYTIDLEEIPVFATPKHRKTILRCIRNNRDALKSLMYVTENMPAARTMPLKDPLYRYQ